MATLRELLAEAAAPPREDVELNGVPFVMVGLSVSEQTALSGMDDLDATFWLLEHMIRDPADMTRVFGDDDPLLRSMGMDGIRHLADVATRLMGVKEQSKNSEAVPSSAG